MASRSNNQMYVFLACLVGSDECNIERGDPGPPGPPGLQGEVGQKGRDDCFYVCRCRIIFLDTCVTNITITSGIYIYVHDHFLSGVSLSDLGDKGDTCLRCEVDGSPGLPGPQGPKGEQGE